MAVSYLRNGGDVFSLQKLLGHSSLDMTRRYAELSQTDVQDKHRLYSPADRLESANKAGGRKRLK
jgi:integrase/recombinase XerD